MLLEDLSKEQQEAVLKEVGYTREQLEADVLHIKEWLKEQHHLPPSRLKESDSFLKFFLTGCKGSLATVKKKLDGYYTIRSYSEVYDGRDPTVPEYEVMRKIALFCIIPKALSGPEPVRLVFSRLHGTNPDLDNFLCYIKIIANFSEFYIRSGPESIRMLLILDAEGISASHVLKIVPTLLRDLLQIGLGILPLRFSDIYVFNMTPVLETAVNAFIVPFLSKKIKSRLHITSGGFEECLQHIDKRYLPKDYNGECPTVKEMSDLWYDKEIENRDWYLNELSERCDESKRLVHEDTQTNPYFGVHGSLKKLVID